LDVTARVLDERYARLAGLGPAHQGPIMGAGLAYQPLAPHALAQRWRDLVAQPGLPERWEIDEYGEVVEMNPPAGPHQRIVTALLMQLREQLGGDPLPGIGVVTRIGVRVPDVCWNAEPHADDPVVVAPAICIEVQSESNTRKELDEKLAAYLASGAREVILVEMSGRIRWFDTGGERAASAFALKLTLPPHSYPLDKRA
jgi:Uma2 family endonuclease